MVVGLAGCTEAKSSTTSTPTAEFRIDTHTHFYDPTRSAPTGRDRSVPWPAAGDPLYRTVLPPDYLALARPLGITGTVVVEASPWIEDNDWLLDLAAQHSVIVGVIGNLREVMGSAEFAPTLDRLKAKRLFRGIRVNAAQVKSALENPAVLADLQRLADADLVVETNGVPLGQVALLAAQVPRLRVVIEHMGNVSLKTAPAASWSSGIDEAARQPNVFMKVSGLLDATGAKAPSFAPSDVETYRAVLDHVFNAFGEDRVIYGSNWPVSEAYGTLATVQDVVTSYVNARGAAAKEKFFWRNARVIYKL